MKTLASLVLALGALASPFAGPIASHAQSTTPITRAQVSSDLIRLEQAGYHVGDGDQTTYPAQVQAAEAKIAAQDSKQAADNAVGGATIDGTSAAGSPASPAQLPQSLPPSCVGPASYCNIYFGS